MSTCATCGKTIVQRYDGTFWKAPDPQPMAWFHDLGVGPDAVRWQRACGWAEPASSAPATASDAVEGPTELARNSASEGATEEIEDGFGSSWTTCGTSCDLHVVRPGKVQCNRRSRFCPDLTSAGVPSSDGDRGLSAPPNVLLTEEEIGTLLCRCDSGICPVHNESSDGYIEHRADDLIDAINCILAARTAQPEGIWLCSQCGERPSAMVKIGTSDGWCTACLDEVAQPEGTVGPWERVEEGDRDE